jgi:hypothetical protein
LLDKELTSLLRSTGYEVIKIIGKKILSGDLNLTTISFPIKVMLPLSVLQLFSRSIYAFPIYMNLAAEQTDQLERFKYYITGTIACFHNSLYFLKPVFIP